MTDPLEQPLRDADRNVPRAPCDTAVAVRRRYAKQRRNLRIAGACLFAVAAIAISISIPKKRPIAQVAPSIVAVQPSLDDRIHELTVAKLESNSARRSVASLAPRAADLQLQRDTAALILIYDAEQRTKQNRPRDAIALYQRAIELFPQTHWAQVARERLKEMQT
jgi:hypothetical protein